MLGLFLDIVGVVVLFIASTTKRIGAEFSYDLMQNAVQESVEWDESLENAKRSLPKLGRSVASSVPSYVQKVGGHGVLHQVTTPSEAHNDDHQL